MEDSSILPETFDSYTECRDPGCRRCPLTVRPRLGCRLRSSLARSFYSKIVADQEFRSFNKKKWYDVNLENMDDHLARHFYLLDADEETEKFLQNCEEKSDAIFTQLWHLFARALLAPFLTQTSINGLLGRGSMFVLSGQQFRRLFQLPEDFHAESMLDLGAGDGATTSLLSPMFQHVDVTEVSWPMKRLLTQRGFKLQDVESWHRHGQRYDVICALNLLDRCSHPITLLQHIKTSLKPQGRILLALVWPFQPYVEMSSDHKAQQLLPIKGSTFEEQVSSWIHDLLEPLGLQLIQWSRVPYLCEGDLEQSFYHLTDMLLALKLKK